MNEKVEELNTFLRKYGLTRVRASEIIGKSKNYISINVQRGNERTIDEILAKLKRVFNESNPRIEIRDYIKKNNRTIASVSRVIFPNNTDGYLNGVSRVGNESTYPDEYVAQILSKVKMVVDNEIYNDDYTSKYTKNKKNERKEIEIKEPEKEKEKEQIDVVITNFLKQKQQTIKINKESLADLNKFYESLKENGIINERNASILTII